MFTTLGLDLSKSTVNDWAMKCMELLKPLSEKLRNIVMKCSYLNIDETIMNIFEPVNKKCRKGYIFFWGDYFIL